jgi:hypothetical protein
METPSRPWFNMFQTSVFNQETIAIWLQNMWKLGFNIYHDGSLSSEQEKDNNIDCHNDPTKMPSWLQPPLPIQKASIVSISHWAVRGGRAGDAMRRRRAICKDGLISWNALNTSISNSSIQISLDLYVNVYIYNYTQSYTYTIMGYLLENHPKNGCSIRFIAHVLDSHQKGFWKLLN